MIQAVIARLARNSFLLKGWSVLLVSAMLTFMVRYQGELPSDGYRLFLLPCIPAMMFYFLDAYFLMMERAYRKLYDEVRRQKPEAINFDMDASRWDNCRECVSAFFSKTLLLFHPFVLLAVAAAAAVVWCAGS